MALTNESSNHSDLTDFFNTMLQEIYWSEVHLIDVLSTMETAATTDRLKEVFKTHQAQTKTHIERLEKVFDLLDVPPRPELSVGLHGLIDEAWQSLDESKEGSSHRDVALIIAAQKVEHYEIVCYGSLVTLARTLGKEDVAAELVTTLNEEKDTDALLSSIAESGLNQRANDESGSAGTGGNMQLQSDSSADADLEQLRKEALTERD